MLDVAVEEKPARHLHGAVGIAVLAARVLLVDHAELQRAFVQPLLGGLAGGQVEAPAVQAGLHLVLVQVGHHAFVTGRRTREVLGLGLLLVVAVQHDLVTFLIRIEPMQHEGGRGLEPADLLGLSAARDDGETRGQLGMELHHVLALLQQIRLPEQREVVEDREVLTEAHVVRQARAWQRNGHVMHQLVVPVHHAVVHVGRMLGVVEEQHLTGGLVHLHVGRDAVQRRPGRYALLLQRERVQPVTLAALVVGGEGAARVHHHVGAGGVLDGAMCTPARPRREFGVLHQPGPQAAVGLDLRREPLGLHEAVAVVRTAVLEADHVQHAVAIEGVVTADGLVNRVLRVAQVDAVDVGRDAACDHPQVGGVDFFQQWRPGTLQVGVVAGLDVAVQLAYQFGAHGGVVVCWWDVS